MEDGKSDWISCGCILLNKQQVLDDFLKLAESVNSGESPKEFLNAAYDLAKIHSFYDNPEYIKSLINTSINKYVENKNKSAL